jgi:hypothetical protein
MAARDSLRDRLDKRLGALDTERNSVIDLWRELRDNFLPGNGRFERETAKDRRRVRLPSTKPVIAARTLGSGLHAGLTSPARPWLKSAVQDDDLAEWGPVKRWLGIVDERMLAYFARSNLYQVLPSMYGEYGTFGTMAGLAFEDSRSLFRFEWYTVGTYHLAKSGTGEYDTLVHEFPMTVRQIVDRWGERSLTRRLAQKWSREDQKDVEVRVIHSVEPSGDGSWRSCYYDKHDGSDAKGGLLLEAMFPGNPVLAASWETVWGETYASNCPGMTAIGAAKALQVDMRAKGRAIEKHHNPPLQGPPNITPSLVPGAYTALDAASLMQPNAGIRSIYDFRPDISGLLDNIRSGIGEVNEAYFVDLFLMLTMDERAQRATAEEIRAKYDEKVLALGPTLERANAMLRSLHGFAFDAMIRKSRPIWEGRMDGEPLLPEPPRELMESGVEIIPEFVSALQMAQRAQRLQGLERFAMAAGQIAQLTGHAPEKFNADQYLDEYAAGLGVPAGVVNDDDTVDGMRQEQANQAKAAQMAQLAPALKQGADAAATLASTKPEDGNILASLAQGLGNGGLVPQ